MFYDYIDAVHKTLHQLQTASVCCNYRQFNILLNVSITYLLEYRNTYSNSIGWRDYIIIMSELKLILSFNSNNCWKTTEKCHEAFILNSNLNNLSNALVFMTFKLISHHIAISYASRSVWSQKSSKDSVQIFFILGFFIVILQCLKC